MQPCKNRVNTPPNSILYSTSATPNDGHPDYLVFFAPGNPCLVEFYRGFLASLHAQIAAQLGPSARVDVLGISLRGFECEDVKPDDVRTINPISYPSN